jgi:ceramide glucosyltransferase
MLLLGIASLIYWGRVVLVYYLLAIIALWLGLVSLRGGLRFSSYVRREMHASPANYTPFVSVLAPFRGLEEGLKENLTALFEQRYPAYEIIFVTDSAVDPGLRVVEGLRESQSDKLQFVDHNPNFSLRAPREASSLRRDDNLKIVGQGVASKIVIAGAASDSGQKVHNLSRAVSEIDPRTQVLVFVDSDARPHADWLQSLVAPLGGSVEVTTGYRWFIPLRGSVSGHLQSVWNASIASALGEREDKNFCWGGSTAILRSTFEELRIVEKWRGSVSDDFTLTRVLQQAKRPIKFVPQCLIVSRADCTPIELLEFTTRQLKITRVYAGHLWKAILLGSSQFVIVFFGGLGLVVTRWGLGLPITLPLILISIIFALGAIKAWVRLRAVKVALTKYEVAARLSLPAHLLLWPFASALYLYNALAAAVSRRITWRGIRYELKSPVEAVIIARESD